MYKEVMENSIVILQTKEGVKLTADKFIYRGISYPINTMKSACLKEGDYKSPDKLQIEFKDGAIKEFFLQPTVTFKEVLTQRLTFLTNFKFTPLSIMQRNMVSLIIEWATKINELIDKGN
jgi:hypothetical protein